MTSERHGTAERTMIHTWYAYYKTASKLIRNIDHKTHGRRKTPLNPSYSFVFPSLCKYIERISVDLFTASPYKFTL